MSWECALTLSRRCQAKKDRFAASTTYRLTHQVGKQSPVDLGFSKFRQLVGLDGSPGRMADHPKSNSTGGFTVQMCDPFTSQHAGMSTLKELKGYVPGLS